MNKKLLNVALENVLFMFRKVSEEEMVTADQLVSNHAALKNEIPWKRKMK